MVLDGCESSSTGTSNLREGPGSMLVATVARLMTLRMCSGRVNDPQVLSNLCYSLARGMDHAIAHNEVPSKSHELPPLLKQVFRYGDNVYLEAAFMVLMTYVKSACKLGWFTKMESDELLIIAKEVGNHFSTTEDFCIEPTFYPKMKMDCILVSFEVKPGFGTYVDSFHVSRGMVAPEREEICLFAARMDNMDTSYCIITPQEVNFLLNGNGVNGRTSVSMDKGPQLPTNVTAIAKYGVNLLQAVGKFNGHYIVVVAIMSTIPSSNNPELPDYVQPVVGSVDSDVETEIEPRQISLRCPISKSRMKIPIKGHLCKHPQCFDYDVFMTLNSKRPFWRCPLCTQSVFHPDIRIDQDVVKVLREAGDSVVEVTISADGNWKVALENKNPSPQSHGQTQITQPEGLDARELVAPAVNNYQIGSSSSAVNDSEAFLATLNAYKLAASFLLDQLSHSDNVQVLQSAHGNLVSIGEPRRSVPVSWNPSEIQPLPAQSQNQITHATCNVQSQFINQNVSLAAQVPGGYGYSSGPPFMQLNQLLFNPGISNTALLMQVQQGFGYNHPNGTAQHSSESVQQLSHQTNLEIQPSRVDDGLAAGASQNRRVRARVGMRGSLTGEARAAALSRLMGQPMQLASQPPQPPPGVMSTTPNASSCKQ